MNRQDPRSNATKPDAAQPARKRFQIAKLEERIAPSKGGKGTHNCGGGGGGSGASSGFSGSVSIF